MKKITAFICVYVVVSLSFFAFAVTDDYIDGYNQGYADALAGIKNIYEKSAFLDSDNMGIWTIRYFVDSFGDYTEDAYIITQKKGSGTFTTSATNKGDLRWEMLVDEDGNAQFFLYEYGSSLVTGSSSYPTKYKISVKLSDGTVKDFTGENSHDRISIDYSCMLEFLDILLEGDSFKLIITEEGSFFNSTYNLGTIESAGFANAFNKAFPDYDRELIELWILYLGLV